MKPMAGSIGITEGLTLSFCYCRLVENSLTLSVRSYHCVVIKTTFKETQQGIDSYLHIRCIRRYFSKYIHLHITRSFLCSFDKKNLHHINMCLLDDLICYNYRNTSCNGLLYKNISRGHAIRIFLEIFF